MARDYTAVWFFRQWVAVTVPAYGPERPFQIKLPRKPRKVELDPDLWVLSEKTETKRK